MPRCAAIAADRTALSDASGAGLAGGPLDVARCPVAAGGRNRWAALFADFADDGRCVHGVRRRRLDIRKTHLRLGRHLYATMN